MMSNLFIYTHIILLDIYIQINDKRKTKIMLNANKEQFGKSQPVKR